MMQKMSILLAVNLTKPWGVALKTWGNYRSVHIFSV